MIDDLADSFTVRLKLRLELYCVLKTTAVGLKIILIAYNWRLKVSYDFHQQLKYSFTFGRLLDFAIFEAFLKLQGIVMSLTQAENQTLYWLLLTTMEPRRSEICKWQNLFFYTLYFFPTLYTIFLILMNLII